MKNKIVEKKPFLKKRQATGDSPWIFSPTQFETDFKI